MAEAMPGGVLGPGLKKLEAASISCLLGYLAPSTTPIKMGKQSLHTVLREELRSSGQGPCFGLSRQRASTYQPCEGAILKAILWPLQGHLSQSCRGDQLSVKPCLNCRFVSKINAYRWLSHYIL